MDEPKKHCMLSETGQLQNKYCIINLYKTSRVLKFLETQSSGYQRLGKKWHYRLMDIVSDLKDEKYPQMCFCTTI